MRCPACQTDNPSDSKYCKECSTPLPARKDASDSQKETLVQPIKELTAGTIFSGRYQVIEELGQGGMGKVYEKRVSFGSKTPWIAASSITLFLPRKIPFSQTSGAIRASRR